MNGQQPTRPRTAPSQPREEPSPALLDDLPAAKDALDFSPYVEALADIVSSPRTRTPLTVGVFGTWGAGKTSLMRMIRDRLPEGCVPVWFDAWKYDREEALWRALLLRVLAALKEVVEGKGGSQGRGEAGVEEADGEGSRGRGEAGGKRAGGGEGPEERARALAQLEDLETAVYRSVDREEVGRLQIDWSKLSGAAAAGAVQVGLSFLPGGGALAKLVEGLKEKGTEEAAEDLFTAVRRERTRIHVEQVRFLEQFQDRFRQLVQRHVVGRQASRGEGAGEPPGRLVVFIDDLDRCLPEKAVEVLEAVKLFLDVPGCAFVLALDPAVIARGIEIKYRELERAGADGDGRRPSRIDGARYLEKIVQVPFQLPPIETEDLAAFVDGLLEDWPHPECPRVFAHGLGANPRQVKRTVNVFLLLWRLAQARSERLQGRIQPVPLAKVVALQHLAPGLYEVVRETPRLLRDLEAYFHAEKAVGGERAAVGKGTGDGEAGPQGPEPPPAVKPYLTGSAGRRLARLFTLHTPEEELGFSNLTPEDLATYFTLTRRAEAPGEAAPRARDGIPIPETVAIPAGSFLMGSTEEQVEEMVRQGAKKEWVQGEARQHPVELPAYAIGKYPVTNAEYQAFIRDRGYSSPQHWDGESYPEAKGGHPVVGVSWHDAREYCRWLAEKTGRLWRLPTEAEWEKAARGTDGRLFPWGEEWDEARLNSKEKGPGGTTPVGQYSPHGDSPYGAADMAGNVWEWTGSLLKPYPYVEVDGREDLEAEGLRVLRGGSFIFNRRSARCAFRNGNVPDLRLDLIGFRVVVSPSPLASDPSDL